MHRYEELEKIYYKKLYLKIFFGLLVIVILIIGSIFYIKTMQKQFKKNFKYIEKVKLNKKVEKSPAVFKQSSKKEVKNVKKEVKSLKNYELKFILPDINSIPVSKEEKHIIKKEKNSSKIENKNIKQVIKKVSKIKIKESDINLDALIKEYKNNPSYNLAITLAKIYFKKNNLKQAQIWALKANSLDPSRPDSWFLFADILIKEHKLKKAKKILNIYKSYYNNNDIINEKLRSINEK